MKYWVIDAIRDAIFEKTHQEAIDRIDWQELADESYQQDLEDEMKHGDQLDAIPPPWSVSDEAAADQSIADKTSRPIEEEDIPF